jgi:toluene monooxygenase system ferredoxin subunit
MSTAASRATPSSVPRRSKQRARDEASNSRPLEASRTFAPRNYWSGPQLAWRRTDVPLQKAIPVAFTFICHKSAVSEGGIGLFHAGKKSVLLVWPNGGELKAYRGRCPHADMPLDEATFNGKTVTCAVHQWGFDGASGKCVTHLVRNALHPYALRVEGDEIEVDVGPPKAARSSA